MTDSDIFTTVAEKLSLSSRQIQTVSGFLDDGATIPFIARYRQERTGELDEEQLRSIRDELDFQRLLSERKDTILKTIDEQGKLTDELSAEIAACKDLKKLEDLYLPYKPKRKTRASVAREKGLEPLAELIQLQQTKKGNPEQVASEYINEENEVPDADAALQGARDIVAEWVNENSEVRDALRKHIRKHGAITSKRTKSGEDEKQVYQSYYEFNTKIKQLRPHQILALNRGERDGILMVDLDVWEERALELIDEVIIQNEDHIFIDHLEDAISDAYKRLLLPALERELRSDLTDKADAHAIETFATNLKNLLMQPPLSDKVVMGIDPGYRTGCKVAVVDQTGKYLEGGTIFPTPPQKKIAESKKFMNGLIDKFSVNLIAIGNGTGCRETEAVVAEMIQERPADHNSELAYLIVDEAGASVYSASKQAREEFPELDAAQRGNISIARRVQDPLAELVKIDPKSIGVGLYQHDVNQRELSRKLDDVVESCVNSVGVNLNTASAELLNYVSGLSSNVARKILDHRNRIGRFTNRHQLMDVAGVGAFRFEQAAGFLRLPGSDNPLDNTAIHPESYQATEKLCEQLGIDLQSLSDQKEKIGDKLEHIDPKATAEKIGVGVPTFELIKENLLKPGRDPRESLPKPILRQDVLSMDDLNEGQQLEGTVRNVVDFGAFVDLGVKQDGLLHISNMNPGGARVKDPHQHVAVGDIIKVEVESLDKERGRIGLKLIGRNQ